jgi:hypothetical protein
MDAGRVMTPAATSPDGGESLAWDDEPIRGDWPRHKFTFRRYFETYGIEPRKAGDVLRLSVRMLRREGWKTTRDKLRDAGLTISNAVSIAAREVDPDLFNLNHGAMRAIESIIVANLEAWAAERNRIFPHVEDAIYRAIWRVENKIGSAA